MSEEILMFAIPIAQFGSATLTLGHVVFLAAVIVVISFVSVAFVLVRSSRARALAAADAALRAQEAEQRMREVTRVQAELHGRLGTMAEIFGSRQAELTKALSERLD